MDNVKFTKPAPQTETVALEDNGDFPNHPKWPLVVYRKVHELLNIAVFAPYSISMVGAAAG